MLITEGSMNYIRQKSSAPDEHGTVGTMKFQSRQVQPSGSHLQRASGGHGVTGPLVQRREEGMLGKPPREAFGQLLQSYR